MKNWQHLKIVTYHTPKYEQEAARLKHSTDLFDIPLVVYKLPETTWREAVRRKPMILLAAMAAHNTPLMFIDADATLMKDPREFDPGEGDFLIYGTKNRPHSGTIILQNTPRSSEIVRDWINKDELKCPKRPQAVLRRVAGVSAILDPRWCWICDISPTRHRDVNESYAIVWHTQASRIHKE